MQLVHAAQQNIRSLLEQCNVKYEVYPFDKDLYQQCIDVAIQRGYPVDGDQSVRTYLKEGVFYAANCAAHLPRYPIQVYIALYTSTAIFVDDIGESFQTEIPKVYQFNDKFIRKEPQGSDVLDAFADVIRWASEIYSPVVSQLITTGSLGFVAANLLEYGTKSMKIQSAAEQYPVFQRTLSGDGEPYAFMVFPPETPVSHYVQAVPEMTILIQTANDVLSFYKEERIGETTNYICTLAARINKSKLEAFGEATQTAIDLYKRIAKILEPSPEASEAFQRYFAGYIYFHTSTPRYRLADLNL